MDMAIATNRTEAKTTKPQNHLLQQMRSTLIFFISLTQQESKSFNDKKEGQRGCYDGDLYVALGRADRWRGKDVEDGDVDGGARV
ncbi:hypothetical protein L6452_02400 [Arctium lappa]|uniref:Uncharacterized protein n=1 Tax=Arctium lappa TaxID=4217 RepID=A0ACB9FJA7_ARCLA|nr:hypothetical protein L6452_02400 [Arctium lappa]